MTGMAQRRNFMKIETMYFYHLDELREDNNINIDDFIEDICSKRQYWRYKNGENICPQVRLSKFIERLELTNSEFLNYFYRKELNEFEELDKLYKYIQANEYKKAKIILDSFENVHLTGYETKSLYELCKLLFNNTFSKRTIEQKIRNYATFIDYPGVLQKSYYSFRDIVLLVEIAAFEAKQNRYDAVNRLYEILKEDITYVSGNSRFYMPTVFVTVVKIYGSSGDIQKALDLSQEGIQYSKYVQDSRALPNLYHLSAISKYKLGKAESEYQSDIAHCIFSALVSHSVDVYQTYVKLIHKVFGYTEEDIKNFVLDAFPSKT